VTPLSNTSNVNPTQEYAGEAINLPQRRGRAKSIRSLGRNKQQEVTIPASEVRSFRHRRGQSLRLSLSYTSCTESTATLACSLTGNPAVKLAPFDYRLRAVPDIATSRV